MNTDWIEEMAEQENKRHYCQESAIERKMVDCIDSVYKDREKGYRKADEIATSELEKMYLQGVEDKVARESTRKIIKEGKRAMKESTKSMNMFPTVSRQTFKGGLMEAEVSMKLPEEKLPLFPKQLLKRMGIREVIFNEDATIVYLTTGEKGVAMRNECDEFDPVVGISIAYAVAEGTKGNKTRFREIANQMYEKHLKEIESKDFKLAEERLLYEQLKEKFEKPEEDALDFLKDSAEELSVETIKE